jgi:glycosyltransferase involved in cell wall biosynthesis
MALSIAHVGTIDEGGGAAAVAGGLMRAANARGHRAWHLVGRKHSRDPQVVVLPDDTRPALRASGYAAAQASLRSLAGRFPDRGFGWLSRTLRLATHPRAARARRLGLDDFEFPATAALADLIGGDPDILHLHNLHGGYFDLRALPALSRRVPTVITLHDMWTLTGHCAHSLKCERWMSGCGQCPALHLDPAVRRDATDDNWRLKQSIYAASHLHIVSPSRWLSDKVEASMLMPAAASLRVIANGVDTSVFRPADRAEARRSLGLPADALIVMLTTGSRGSMWKDDRTLRETMRRLSREPFASPVLFVAVGRESAITGSHGASTHAVRFQHDPGVMARYYQASDIYLHAAHADTFPLAVLEAMACGAAVVATRVGGIAEQIAPAPLLALRAEASEAIGGATGVLVGPESGLEMADATALLLSRPEVRDRLAANARRSIEQSFTLERQVARYFELYAEILQSDRRIAATA